MKRLVGAAAGLLLGAAGVSSAATVIELEGTDNGQPVASNVTVNAGWIQIAVEDGGVVTHILYDASADTAYIVDHLEKAYTELTEQGIEQIGNQIQAMMAQVQAQLNQSAGALTEAQQAQQNAMSGTLGNSQAAVGEPPKKARFDASGNNREVNGIPCEDGFMSVNGAPTTRLCIADRNDIPLPDADYEALRSLAAFGGRIAGKVASIFPAVGLSVPSFDIDSIAGLPVEVRDGATLVAVASIHVQDLPPIGVPDEYTRRPIPLLGQP